MVFSTFSFQGVTRAELRQLFDPDSTDQIPKIGPGFLLFLYESLFSKVSHRDTRDSSSSSV